MTSSPDGSHSPTPLPYHKKKGATLSDGSPMIRSLLANYFR